MAHDLRSREVERDVSQVLQRLDQVILQTFNMITKKSYTTTRINI